MASVASGGCWLSLWVLHSPCRQPKGCEWGDTPASLTAVRWGQQQGPGPGGGGLPLRNCVWEGGSDGLLPVLVFRTSLSDLSQILSVL